MSGLDSIFDALNEKVDIEVRLETIDRLFSREKSAMYTDWFGCNSGSYDKTIEEAGSGDVFLAWPYRNGTSSPEHMREVLGLAELSEFCNDRRKVCYYLEYVYNVTNLVFGSITDFNGEFDEHVVMAIIRDVTDAAGVLGMKFVDVGDGRRMLCANDAPIIEAASVSDLGEMGALVEYLHFATEGNLGKKSDCLARLYKGYEGRSEKLVGDEFKNLRDEIGMLANSLNTRHNNREGKNAKTVLESMPEAELEGWYDYLAGLFAEAILAERRVDMRSDSKVLRDKLRQ